MVPEHVRPHLEAGLTPSPLPALSRPGDAPHGCRSAQPRTLHVVPRRARASGRCCRAHSLMRARPPSAIGSPVGPGRRCSSPRAARLWLACSDKATPDAGPVGQGPGRHAQAGRSTLTFPLPGEPALHRAAQRPGRRRPAGRPSGVPGPHEVGAATTTASSSPNRTSPTSWESTDAQTWVFHLKPAVTFQAPVARPVTAQDFVDSWTTGHRPGQPVLRRLHPRAHRGLRRPRVPDRSHLRGSRESAPSTTRRCGSRSAIPSPTSRPPSAIRSRR